MTVGALGLLLATPVHAQTNVVTTVSPEMYQQQYVDGLAKLVLDNPGKSIYSNVCQSSSPTLSLEEVQSFVSGSFSKIPYLTPPLIPERFDITDPHGYTPRVNASDVTEVKVKVRKEFSK